MEIRGADKIFQQYPLKGSQKQGYPKIKRFTSMNCESLIFLESTRQVSISFIW